MFLPPFFHPIVSISTYTPQTSVCINWKHMQFFYSILYPIMGYSLYLTLWDLLRPESNCKSKSRGEGVSVGMGPEEISSNLEPCLLWVFGWERLMVVFSVSLLPYYIMDHQCPVNLFTCPYLFARKSHYCLHILIKLENQFQKLQNHYRKLISTILFF